MKRSKQLKSYSPKTLNGFWKNRVNKWTIKSIKICVDAPINIAAMTLICCYIDFFGGLLKPKSRTRNRFYAFIDEYLNPINEKYKFWECKLYEDFRCGLVHEAIMKKGTGIFRSDESEDTKYFEHLGEKDGLLWIDLIQFYGDFKQAVINLKKDLDKKSENKKLAIQRLNNLGWDKIRQ